MLIKFVPDCVIFDLETTGLSPEKESIIEISALRIKGGEIVDEFSTLVNPGVHIPYESSAITGITDDMVAGSPDVKAALGMFRSFVGNEVLVGHNIRNFDLKFIQRDALKYFGSEMTNEYVDTLVVARRCLPQLSSRSLESLSSYYGVSYDGAHRALADCHITYEIYKRLKDELNNPCDAAKSVPVCPRCGNVLTKRNGKFGEFWGCKSYPECRFTKDC